MGGRRHGLRRLTPLAGALLMALSAASPAASQSQVCPQDSPSYTGPCGPTFVLPPWGDAGGWTQPEQYETIQLADVDGDDRDELLGRTPAGLAIYDFDTALGQWRPQVDANDRAVMLTQFANPPQLIAGQPKPSGTDWTRPEYYDTIQAADIDGQKGEEVIARSAQGVIVFKYTPGASGQSGNWRQLTTSGPYADPDWAKGPYYYATLQTGDLDGDGDHELFARGRVAVAAQNWNGSGWSEMTPLNFLTDDRGGQNPAYWTSLRAGRMDAGPADAVFGRNVGGVIGFKLASRNWSPLRFSDPPFSDITGIGDCPFTSTTGSPCLGSSPSYYSTLQLADVNGDGRDEIVARASDGVRVARYDGTSVAGRLPTLTDLSDANGWKAESRYETIQFADINGDEREEALARGSDQLHAWTLDPPMGSSSAWKQLPAATPLELADDPWAGDRSYYATIQTGDVDGDKRADVIARGPYGIRTWFYDRVGTGGWESYLPAGYPAFSGAQATAFDALTTRAKDQGLITGSAASVRSFWASETAPSQSDLTTLQNELVTIGGCTGQTSQEPPHYGSCTPPPGSSGFTAADWTAVMNEVLAEAYWARQAIAHFDDVDATRESLFIEQGAELPAIGRDLRLADAANEKAEYDPKDGFEGMLGVAGELVGDVVPEAAVALEIGAELLSTLPSSSPTLTTPFEGTYEDLQQKFAASIAEVDKALAAHSQLVRQNLGLLTLVGELRSRGTWTAPGTRALDRVGIASAARQGFALSIYKTLLPTVWDRYAISGCRNNAWAGIYCTPPPKGPWMSGSALDFTALGPARRSGVPCQENRPAGPGATTWVCNFQAPQSAIANTLWTPVPSRCAYQPGNANTAWTFGCSLGIDPAETLTSSSTSSASRAWTFPTVSGSPVVGRSLAGTARAIGRPQGRLALRGRVPLPRALRIPHAKVTLDRLLFERHGGGELVRRRSGARMPNLQLTARRHGRRGGLFVGGHGRTRVRMRMNQNRRSVLWFRLTVRNMKLTQAPSACAGTRRDVDLASRPIELHHRLRLTDGHARPLTVSLRPQWNCRRDRAGNVRRLALSPPKPRRLGRRALRVAVLGRDRAGAGARPAGQRIRVTNTGRRTAHDVFVRAVPNPKLRLRQPRALRPGRGQALWRLRRLRTGQSRLLRLSALARPSAQGRGCYRVIAQAVGTRPASKRRCLVVVGKKRRASG